MDYRDADTLQRLYWDEDLTLEQMARKLDCSPATVSKWMNKLDVETDDKGRGRNEVNYCNFWTSDNGYEVAHGGNDETIAIHRLVAIAQGLDITNKDIHHKNEIPWDNRPCNLEPCTHKEHMRKHSHKI